MPSKALLSRPHPCRGDEGVTITTDTGESVHAKEVLAATGRNARSEGLGLATVGLADGDWIEADDTMRVQGATP